MGITSADFGKLSNGKMTHVYTLTNDIMSVKVIDYGCNIISILTPDKNGAMGDVVCGFNTIKEYEFENKDYLGAIIGRNANRIAGGRFELDGTKYALFNNKGENHLHGGQIGFDKVLWNSKIVGDSLELSYLSVDMEEGYPGNLSVKCIYSLSEDNKLSIRYIAQTDKATVINITNHSYFDLTCTGDAMNQILQLNADKFTEVDTDVVTTGKILPVDGTPMDFRMPTKIGLRIDDDFEQLKLAGGYDHNWILSSNLAAILTDEISGRQMTTYTSKPGIQFYAGNFLDGTMEGKRVYNKRSAVCLETQYFPNSINLSQFPDVVLRPGKIYDYTTSYQFGTI